MAPSRWDYLKKNAGAVSQKLASFHLILSLATTVMLGHRVYIQTLFSYAITGEWKLAMGRSATSATITPSQAKQHTAPQPAKKSNVVKPVLAESTGFRKVRLLQHQEFTHQKDTPKPITSIPCEKHPSHQSYT